LRAMLSYVSAWIGVCVCVCVCVCVEGGAWSERIGLDRSAEAREKKSKSV
jgi:hypothetical protein